MNRFIRWVRIIFLGHIDYESWRREASGFPRNVFIRDSSGHAICNVCHKTGGHIVAWGDGFGHKKYCSDKYIWYMLNRIPRRR